MRLRSASPVSLCRATKLAARTATLTAEITSASLRRSRPRRLVTVPDQPVTGAAPRLDRRRSAVVRELPAQVADVHLQYVRAGLVVEAPHGVEDLLSREHLPRGAHQVGEQLELAGGELHLSPAAVASAAAEVEAEVADLEQVGRLLV